MNKLIVLIVVLLALVSQAAANTVTDLHEQSTVVSAMLYEPYLAALMSLIVLIATLI
jgi:hypothetical protein